MTEPRKLDWNDLHCEYGLDVVRQQLFKAANEPAVRQAGQPAVRQAGQPAVRQAGQPAVLDDLPPAPSGAAASGNGAAPTEGGGEGWTLEKVLARFALVEGETKVFDLYRKATVKKAGFEAMLGKALAKAWFDLTNKKMIDVDHARRLEAEAKLGRRLQKVTGDKGPDVFWRYVYLDGSQDIYDRHLRQRLPAGAVKLALGDAFSTWQNDDRRRVIPAENLLFDPRMTECPADTINTFEGLPLTPNPDHELCVGIVRLVRFLCNGQEDALHWLMCFLAYPLQKVGAKLDTAVLMHSTMEGSGKSLLFDKVMRVIYGEYGATVGQAQLESSWTAWQANKLYGLFEEVVSRDQRYNQVGKIKHMVTGATVRIESKFVNGWEEANYMNAIFLSNEIMPWPIGENDRRMLVLWPERTLPANAQQRIKWELANGGIEAFYHYLLEYDTGDFDERTRPPHTSARQRLVELSRASWETFYFQWRAGELGVPFDMCLTQDLHDLFLEWCAKLKEHSLSGTKFSLFLSTKPDTYKTSMQIGWVDDNKAKHRSIFFTPSPPPNLNMSDATQVGQQVREWRTAAWRAGWKTEKWEKCVGFAAPLAGSGGN